jgi:hypothetical protein
MFSARTTGTVCANCHCITGMAVRRAERWRMISATWRTLKDVVLSFIGDEALTRGAAIAFYTATSIAPVLLIVIAIAGLVFGQEAAQNAITSQFSDLMGHWRRSLNRHGVGRIWRDASRLERNLESEPSNYNGVPVDPCARRQFRIGGRFGILAYRFAGN